MWILARCERRLALIGDHVTIITRLYDSGSSRSPPSLPGGNAESSSERCPREPTARGSPLRRRPEVVDGAQVTLLREERADLFHVLVRDAELGRIGRGLVGRFLPATVLLAVAFDGRTFGCRWLVVHTVPFRRSRVNTACFVWKGVLVVSDSWPRWAIASEQATTRTLASVTRDTTAARGRSVSKSALAGI